MPNQYLAEKRDLAKWNKARRDAGLPEIKPKTRECMRCRKTFESIGMRICFKCKAAQEHLNHRTPEELWRLR